MKPILLKMTALMCVILLIASLTACAKKADNGAANGDTAETTDTITPAVTEAPTTLATQPFGSNEADPSGANLVGTWDYKVISGYQYTFNEDGTGYYNSLGEIVNFTYETDGTALTILYEDTETPVELEYEIVGNALNIKDAYEVITTYVRK